MSKICPLFSGSTGNSTYISGAYGSVLVDAGASFKALQEAAEAIGEDITEISAVFITHEHIDHIKGLKPLLNKTGVPLFASEKTLEKLADSDKIPKGTKVFTVDGNDPRDISGIAVTRFATSHDCEGSSGYTLLMPDGVKVAVCTDLGKVTEEVRSAVTGCNAVLLESNHDVEMLKKGPYPPELKVRIMSDKGHISNNACAAELKNLLENGTTRFILGHLSQKNNTPLLALSTSESALIDIGAKNGRDCILSVAKPKMNKVTVL